MDQKIYEFLSCVENTLGGIFPDEIKIIREMIEKNEMLDITKCKHKYTEYDPVFKERRCKHCMCLVFNIKKGLKNGSTN